MKKILIIGGSGYIGTFLSEYLRNKNLETTVFGNRQHDYNNLDSSFLGTYDYIVLLAGHSSVQSCVGELSSPWNNNVRNFSNLVNKLNNNQKLIYASSASVYGNKGNKLFNESDLNLEFINNYDLTKTSLDLLAFNYINEGKQIIGFRFGTVNGASNVIRRDLMINSMVYSAIKNKIINVNNKSVSRPILGLEDLGRAFLTVINNSFITGIYNLASFNSSVDLIARTVQKYTLVDIIDKGDYPGIYNFEISTDKFCSTYKFNFKETIDTIIPGVFDCYHNPNVHVVARNEYFKYGKM